MVREPLEIMIIEDNIGDALLISELLEEIGLSIHTTIAKDGRMAMDIFKKENVSPNVSVPDLVILDLNLPKVHGFDILAYMKATPNLRSIPVVVMTGSLNREDEKRARSMGVTDYCNKPATADEMDVTTGCLKRHLEPLMHLEKGGWNHGPSVMSDRHSCNSSEEKGQTRPSENGDFLNDRCGPDIWGTLR
jgi:two-component system, chemotaxis family, response regulator Rcp1